MDFLKTELIAIGIFIFLLIVRRYLFLKKVKQAIKIQQKQKSEHNQDYKKVG